MPHKQSAAINAQAPSSEWRPASNSTECTVMINTAFQSAAIASTSSAVSQSGRVFHNKTSS